MTSVLAIASQKGGTGKTTTAINLGAAIAELGKKVLLVDLDPQGHLAEGFGIVSDNLPHEVSDVLEGSQRLADIIMPAIRPNLDLAPSNIKLADMELSLVNVRFREFKLKRALEPVVGRYDYLLLDCPPSLGLLTVNALIAADYALIPMTTEYLSMLGVSRLLGTIETIQAEGNTALKVLGIILTRANRTVHSREVAQKTRMELGGHIHIFEPQINDSTRFRDASGMGQPIFEVAPDTQGAHAYRSIAKEIIDGTH